MRVVRELLQKLTRSTCKMSHTIDNKDPEAVSIAIETLRRGGVIAMPTDTVYGLACSATNVSAIGKLYEIKSRNEHKPVAICVGRQGDVAKWAKCSHLPARLLETLLPGPVTLILECVNALDKSLVFDGKLGVRIPEHAFIQEVAQGLDCPIALTSANVSSRPSSVAVEEFQELWDRVDCVFDGGHLAENRRNASTVVDLSETGCFKVRRNGCALERTVDVLTTFGLRNKC